MVKIIKNIGELEQLTQQAKNDEISWDERVKLESNITIDKPFGDIFSESWSKVKHIAPGWGWGRDNLLMSQIRESGRLFTSGDGGSKFRSKEILEEFRKHINTDIYPELNLENSNQSTVKISKVSENDSVTNSWSSIKGMLEGSHRIFAGDGSNDIFQSECALHFLQSLVDNKFLQTIEYQAGEDYSLKELNYSAYLTDVQERLNKDKVLKEENESLKKQAKDLQGKISGLESQLKTEQNAVSKLNEDINDLDKKNQDLKKQIEDLEKQLEQAKASSSLVVQEDEGLEWVKLLNLKNISIHHADLNIFLKQKKEKFEQKEIYWDDITKTEEEETKDQISSWLTNIVDSTNKEVVDYNSNVNRIKGNNYHQRGHYFIFYEDGSKAHWLALYPMFDDEKLADGHNHKAFILEFDKPVKKFVDVYTCIGCGAAKQGYTALHKDYDVDKNNPSDSWEVINKTINGEPGGKSLPFEPWFTEFTNATLKDIETDTLQSGEKVAPSIAQFWISPNGKLLGNKADVWQGQEIKDSAGKSFDRAYGFIPAGGTIQWKLEASLQIIIEENKKLAIDKVPNYIDSLWENKDFTDWKDKSPYQQRMAYSFIKNCLKEKDHVLVFKHSGGEETLKINESLTKVGDNFRELISAKKASYKFLEKWIQKILDGDNIRKEIKKDEEFVALKGKPLAVREVWNKQVESFIREKKAKDFYSEHHQEWLTWEDNARTKIDWLYEEVRGEIKFEKQVLEYRVEVLPK